jgi:hypothetical protein
VQDWLSFGEKLSNLPGEVVVGKQRSPWRYLIYGAVSGAVSRSVTAPLERLKILNQVLEELTPWCSVMLALADRVVCVCVCAAIRCNT